MNKNKYKKPIYAIREDSNDSISNNSENDGKTKQLWCICRSEDGARFMICCDYCEEWYHGDCVNITPKQSDLISKYYCAQCQKNNPSLKIQYKPGFIKRTKDIQPPKVDKVFKVKTEDKLSDHTLQNLKFNKPPKFKLIEDRNIKIKSEDRLPEPSQPKHDKHNTKIKTEEKIYDQYQSKHDKSFKPKPDDRYIDQPPSKLDKTFKQIDPNPTTKEPPPQYSHMRFEKSSKIKVEDSVIKFSEKPPVKPGSCGECMPCLRKVDCQSCQNCKLKSDKGCMKRVCQELKPNTPTVTQNKPVDKPIVPKPDKVMLTKLPGEFIPTKTVAPVKKSVSRPPTASVTLKTVQNIGMSSSSPSSNEVATAARKQNALKRPLSPSTESDTSSVLSTKRRPILPENGGNRGTYSGHNRGVPVMKKPRLRLPESQPPSNKTLKSQPKFIQSSESSDDPDVVDEEIDEEDDDDDDFDDDSSESHEDDDNNQSSGSFVLRNTSKSKPKSGQSVIKKKLVPQPSNCNDQMDTACASPSAAKLTKSAAAVVGRPRKGQISLSECSKQYKASDCQNIGCNKPSRVGSKYCSDSCGIRLAEQRLLKYLPSRITNWNNSVSISNQRDRRIQAEIQEECETIHYNLNILDKSLHDLIEFIDRWRSSCSASPTTDEDERRVPGINDDSVQCVTCGCMVGSTKALAHMENCYQKIEGGTMVFADFEEQPIGTKLFCDFYDNNIRGFCKRLAALCDHNKDTKVDPKTICAFPLSVNEKSDRVCLTAKIKCNRHVNWERIQRAVIDINRYRLLVRYEELQVEDRKYKQSVAQRGNVMALLLHDTIDHQPLKPLVPSRNAKDRTKKMRKFTKAMCI